MQKRKEKNRFLTPGCSVSWSVTRFKRKGTDFKLPCRSGPSEIVDNKGKPQYTVPPPRGSQNGDGCSGCSREERLGEAPRSWADFQHHAVTRAHLTIIQEEFQGITASLVWVQVNLPGASASSCQRGRLSAACTGTQTFPAFSVP